MEHFSPALAWKCKRQPLRSPKRNITYNERTIKQPIINGTRDYHKQTINQHQIRHISQNKVSKVSPNLLKLNPPNFLKNKNRVAETLKKINFSDFDLGEMLGRGANGCVYIVRHKKTGCFFALKKYPKKYCSQKLNRFIASIKIQMFSDDPNIAKIYDVMHDQQNIYLLMEYCIEGDLTERIKSLRKNPQAVKEIIIGIVRGLKYLHSMKILHRDLKLQNILLCYDMPKITDFDLAVYQQNSIQSRRTFCGSPAYFSPQMLTKNAYNSKVDIWCLGILCFQLVNGYPPFCINNYEDVNNIVNCPVKQYTAGIEEDIRDFIEIMLIKDPQLRAGWKEILTHRFLI